MENDSDTIQICEVKNQNMYITVEKTKWKSSLDSALQFYIDKDPDKPKALNNARPI